MSTDKASPSAVEWHDVNRAALDKDASEDVIAAFVGGEKNILLTQLGGHILPRSKHALTPNVVALVENTVKDSHTEVGHTDLIRIGEAEGKTCLDFFLVLYNLPIFTARISSGLLNRAQK